MNKINHSKYKNTGIIFETLIRQIASDTMSNKDSKAVEIIKKYFTNTELAKEQKLYAALTSSKTINETKADGLINSVLDLSKRLNKTKLRKEKYALIKEIKDSYDIDNFFKAKIHNYKTLASIYTLIESYNSSEFIDPNQVIDNKYTLLEFLTKQNVDKVLLENKIMETYSKYDKGTRILAYKIMLEKFNSKYADLDNDQKLILKEYINNISNTDNLKEFINVKYLKINKELTTSIPQISDPVTKIKLNEILKFVSPIGKTQNVKDENVISILQFYQLIKEIKEVK